ncbi:hypothetical protein BCR37DRAFT_366860 [Protomyces lactucae-debilis]|uniref:Phospholipase n=1 Tax=Protomyces lactucae-debilis TaxID=2754530 RepID=A0A1Y2FJW9_PROLT|nr:uncharacterized protein BCR37DRAFT_366860 [Protomyces lactucae-debilis]ORY83887.1 hypothetical protein BCR37DRAFT_366860 [Protomyces lactucae-debilis]
MAVSKAVSKKKKEQPKGMNQDVINYLIAGALPAVLVGAALMKDERGKAPRVPVIFALLNFELTPNTEGNTNARLHLKFNIELEYGTGDSRKRWVIERDLEDFWRLNLSLGIRRKLRLSKSRKPPDFPSEALPFFRTARNLEGDERTKRMAQDVGSGVAAGIGALAGAVGGASQLVDRDRQYPRIVANRIGAWLRKCLVCYTFREECNRLCKFLELSTLGIRLSRDERKSGKEGFLAIRSIRGATRGMTCNPMEYKRRHKPRWYLVRESYILSVEHPSATEIYDVFFLDHHFDITRRDFLSDVSIDDGKHHHPQHHQFKMKNSERRVHLVAKNERQLDQFVKSIETMAESTPWAKEHRFGSFAPVRTNVAAQWLVDGRDYFWNVSRAIYNAKDTIYIHDWWLSPELYMRRPSAIAEKWRLDRLLQRKAQEGVKIFIIIYQNVGTTVPIDSTYTKYSMMGLHPNILLQRSPGHLKQVTFFWAHHEKILVVDNEIGFVGGLDLCFGRWDTPEHILVDDKDNLRSGDGAETGEKSVPDAGDDVTDKDFQVWPGKDYSNPRVLDFHTLDKPYAELYDRSKIPRMPWHDISMCLLGQAARDIGRHFVQRWNYLLRTKPPRRPMAMLLPPSDYDPADLEKYGLTGTCEVQILRSSGNWSLGLDATEHSIQNAYCSLIKESEHFIYIENQFFITSTEVDGTKIENGIGDALVERIIRAHANQEHWKAVLVVPMLPGFPGSIDNNEGTALRYIMKCQFNSISRGEKSIFGRLRKAGIDPVMYINVFGLRGWGRVGKETPMLVSEMVYIHAKCMIVDDRATIIGSANINERSQRGMRDSEVASVVRDTDMMDSTMGGKPYKVGRFSHTLRMRLMREHLGVNVDEIEQQECHMDGLAKAVPFNRDFKVWNPAEQPGHITNPLPSGIPITIGRTTNLGEEMEHAKRDPDIGFTLKMYKDQVAAEKGKPYTTSANRYADADKKLAELAKELNITLDAPLKPLVHLGSGGTGPFSALDQDEVKVAEGKSQGGFETFAEQPFTNPLTGKEIASVDPYGFSDPLIDSFYHQTWCSLAVSNTDIYREVFRCQPDDQVKTWKDYHKWEKYIAASDEASSSGTLHEKETDSSDPRSTTTSTVPGSPANGKHGRQTRTIGGQTVELPSVEMMEQMLCGIRGHLVIWPTEWMLEADKQNDWLYTIDKVQPIDIYS